MKEIKFNLYTLIKYNSEDEMGLFINELVEFTISIEKVNPDFVTSIDYKKEIRKLSLDLFLKYEYLVLNDKDEMFGFWDNKKILLGEVFEGWFSYFDSNRNFMHI